MHFERTRKSGNKKKFSLTVSAEKKKKEKCKKQ